MEVIMKLFVSSCDNGAEKERGLIYRVSCYFLFLGFGASCSIGAGCAHRKLPAARELAIKAERCGDYQGGVREYGRAIVAEGSSYGASHKLFMHGLYLGRGRCYAALGNNESALMDFGKAGEFLPNDNGQVALARGNLYLSMDRFEDALGDAELILQLNGENVVGCWIKGLALYGLKRYDEAGDFLLLAAKGVEVGSDEWLRVNRVLGLNFFALRKGAEARKFYMVYFEGKRGAGIRLSNDDYYWAGVLADVNLDEVACRKFWSHLSVSYKKTKNIR